MRLFTARRTRPHGPRHPAVAGWQQEPDCDYCMFPAPESDPTPGPCRFIVIDKRGRSLNEFADVASLALPAHHGGPFVPTTDVRSLITTTTSVRVKPHHGKH